MDGRIPQRLVVERIGIEFDEEDDFIRSGMFGIVYKATLKRDGTKVAAKVVRQQKPSHSSQMLLREANILCSIDDHPNVVKMKGWCSEPGFHALLLEFVDGGNLNELIESNKPECPMYQDFQQFQPWPSRLQVAYQTISGLAYLHQIGVVHFDLKTGNVVIARREDVLDCKIIDFGFSKMRNRSGDNTGGTLAYMAPERLNESFGVRGEKCDIFSFGMILNAIANMKEPDGLNSDLKADSDRPIGYAYVYHYCCSSNPAERPTAEKVERMLPYMFSQETVRVTFHALLKVFDWNRGGREIRKVEIHFREPDCLPVSIEVKLAGRSDEEFIRLRGESDVPVRLTRSPLRYCYYVVTRRENKEEPELEFLEMGSCGHPMMRVLEFPDDFLAQRLKSFVKYDDVVCKRQSRLLHFHRQRETALEKFFPRWSGFSCRGDGDASSSLKTAKSALDSLREVTNSLFRAKRQEDIFGSRPQLEQGDGRTYAKILADILKLKLKELVSSNPSNDEEAAERVVSGIAIAIAINCEYTRTLSSGFPLCFEKSDYSNLAETFAVPCFLSGDRTCAAIRSAIDANFGSEGNFARLAINSVFDVIDEICLERHSPSLWIGAVSLLSCMFCSRHDLGGGVQRESLEDCRHNLRKLAVKLDGTMNYDCHLQDYPEAKSLLAHVKSKFHEIDHLLSKAIMRFTSLQDLEVWIDEACPHEIFLALARKITDDSKEIIGLQLQSLLTSLLNRICQHLKESRKEETCAAESGVETAASLLRFVFSNCSDNSAGDIIRLLIDVMFAYSNYSSWESSTESGDLLRAAAQETMEWIFNVTSESVSHLDTIKLCTKMIKAGQGPRKIWEEEFLTKLKEHLIGMKFNSLLDIYMNLDIDIHPVINKAFIFTAEILHKAWTLSKRNESRKSEMEAFFGKLIDRTLCKPSWIEALLEWPTMNEFQWLAAYEGELFGPKSREFCRLKENVNRLAERITTAVVAVPELQLVNKQKEKFVTILRRLEMKSDVWAGRCSLAEQRILELSVFVELCRNFAEDVTLNDPDVFHCALPGKPTGTEAILEMRKCIENLRKLQRSRLFRKCWLNEAVTDFRAHLLSITVEELVIYVRDKVLERWEQLRRAVIDRTISRQTVKEHFQSFAESENDVIAELQLMHCYEDLEESRVDQILFCVNLDQSRVIEYAKSLHSVCEELQLHCKFAFSPQYWKEWDLQSADDSKRKAGQFLSGMTDDQIVILKWFLDTKEGHVSRLRTAVTEAGGLEMFEADLLKKADDKRFAMSKADVSELIDASRAYRPLLCDIQESDSLDELQKACQSVFIKVGQNQNVVQNWHLSLERLRRSNIFATTL
eukprot:m.273500 g.273500  ORF g.273500 m.273500 type:complete len:1340 (+) comp40576_c0_seq5:1269-5288(+)